MANKDGSINIRLNRERAERIKKARIRLLIEQERDVKTSDIVGHLIDAYLLRAIEDFEGEVQQ